MTNLSHRRKISVLIWLGGISALFAEAAIMAPLMLFAGILAVGWGLIETCAPRGGPRLKYYPPGTILPGSDVRPISPIPS
jgi:hypothetical protein